MKDATHSAHSSEWYTPTHILDAAREALGGDFDLDPASCAEANAHVAAKSFYTIASCGSGGGGLDLAWFGRVWCNPPTPPKEWWRAIVSRAEPNHMSGVYLAYSIEQLQQSQRWTPNNSMLSFPVCVPRTRVKFLRPGPEGLIVGPQPTHASAVVGIGVDRDRFRKAFRAIGDCT